MISRIQFPWLQASGEQWGRYHVPKYIHNISMIPSGNSNIAIENGPCIVDLPIKDGDFP